MKRYEIKLKDITDTVKCPNCGLEYKLTMSVDKMKTRYTPVTYSCFDNQPQGKGCMRLFECYIHNENLVVREC